MPKSERDRIARAVIEEAFSHDIAELQSGVAAARRKLAESEEKLKLARKDLRANYVQAVHSYLVEHHPPVRPDDPESSAG